MRCPNCGAANSEPARFCRTCGTSLVDSLREVRKTVTVLFADIAGSTALGERLDPESLRTLMGRYFTETQRVVERHGGVVEKFIGDAVMAVFGIPAVHEDDALRAVRAATEIREALRQLNVELTADFGVEVAVRTGVNTGVVVAGDPLAEEILVGDTVNTAARLEQAAAPGEILLGQQTLSLVRDLVVAEPLEPLQLKGKATPVTAFRLVQVLTDISEHPLASPMIGRDRELAALREAFAQAVAQRQCRLCIVVGQPGIGKSRLVKELASSLGDSVRVLTGRCLSYGEGITFWPVREFVKDAAGILDGDTSDAAVKKLAGLVPGEEGRRVAERIGALVGLVESGSSEAEGFFATRKLLESLALVRPLLLVVEDLHWAEPTLLDLLEYLALTAVDRPIVLLCTARSDLLEERPSWGSAVPGAVRIGLEPLDARGTDELLLNLLGPTSIAADARRRISDTAGGNPLFAEQTFSMLVDQGLLTRDDGSWVLAGDVTALPIPPSIQALLGARIDHLDPEERAVLERASVVGRIFYWSAVADLSPAAARAQVGSRLLSLVRKTFVLPTASDLTGEDAYLFRHILIRDAAYDGIPKAGRAQLHEQMARWLERRVGDRLVEFQEIIGYHLEQAFRCRAELGTAGAWDAVGEAAGVCLAAAGRRARMRQDLPAATGLLERARSLLPAGSLAHRQVGLDLASGLVDAGTYGRARTVLEEVAAAATADGDDVHLAHARLDLARIRVFVDPEGAADNVRIEADAALPVFEAAGDELGIAKVWRSRGMPDYQFARFDRVLQAQEQALQHLRKTSDVALISRVLDAIASCLSLGTTPASDALVRLEEILAETAGNRELWGNIRLQMGVVLALQGREREALDAEAEAESILRELGVEFSFGLFGQIGGDLERFLGRYDRAEQLLRRSDAIYERAGERNVRPTVLAQLAHVLLQKGQTAEAEELALGALQLGASDDVSTVVAAHGVLGRILAGRGDRAAGEHARRAVSVAEKTDMLWVQGEAWEDMAAVLAAEGRVDEAEAALREALARFERKGATLLANRVRARLAQTWQDGGGRP